MLEEGKGKYKKNKMIKKNFSLQQQKKNKMKKKTKMIRRK